MTSQNIEELVDKALSICRKQRFAESSVHSKHKIFKAVIRKHKEKGFDAYNESVLLEYIQEHKDRFDKGLMVKDAFKYKEKTALQLKELVDTGTIEYSKVNRPLGLTDYYSDIIDRMLVFSEWDEKYAYSVRRYVIHFFKWLTANQIDAISDVDETVLRKYMLERSKELRLNSICHVNYGLKCLFYFLKSEGLTESDYQKLID